MSPRCGLPLASALLLVAAACSGGHDETTTAPGAGSGPGTGAAAAAGTDQAAHGDRNGGPEDGDDELTTLVAHAKGSTLSVWDAPSGTDAPRETIRAEDEATSEIVLLVQQELGSDWLEAHLATAPAGATGWVRREDVTLSRHRFRVQVDRASHTMTVYAGEVLVLETPVAIGGSDAPPDDVPLFIKELVETPDPYGPYGRYAYGLSGSSNRAEDFEAGRGVVGIHGTDDETTVGRDVAAGSLAIAAEPLDRMVRSIGLPLGTPVELVP